MPNFRKRPLGIKAKRVPFDTVIETEESVIRFSAGDWMIEGPREEIYRMDHEKFLEYTEPDDADAKDYLKKVSNDEWERDHLQRD